MKKRLVVLGASGFIGYNVWELLKAKYELHLIDKVKLTYEANEGSSFYLQNIADLKSLRKILMSIDPHYVIHLASKSTIEECHHNPREAFLDNVYGNLNVLTALYELQNLPNSSFEKLLVHSSDKAYGPYPQEQLPYLETYAHYPSDIYSTSKACQDMMTLSWSQTFNLKASVVRSGNIYGPGDLNFSRLVPGVLSKLLNDQSPILYEGATLAIRDFVFVIDLINAYEILLERGEIGHAYNIGGSGPMEICEAILIMKQVLNKTHLENKIHIRNVPEFTCQYLDASKIEKLGWKHTHSFHEGITKTLPFYLKKYQYGKIYA